jgi:hypothetical protein
VQAVGLVAGAVALHLQSFPSATPAQARQAVMSASAIGIIDTLSASAESSGALLQVQELTAGTIVSTAPATLELSGGIGGVNLVLMVKVQLGRRPGANVVLRITEKGSRRFFNGTSALILGGALSVDVGLMAVPHILLSSVSSEPFELMVETQSEDHSMSGRHVPILVRLTCSIHCFRSAS